MAGFKNTYSIIYNGKTDNFVYEDLEVEITSPYDWDKQHDVPLLFTIIHNTLSKDFDRYDILSVEKIS